MNKIISLFSVLALLLLGYPSSAQTNIRYFPPERIKGDFESVDAIIRDDRFVYIGGTAFMGSPAIVKIDTSGREIWSFTTNMELEKDIPTRPSLGSILVGHNIANMFVDSNRLYIHLRSYLVDDIILALDPANGNILWRTIYKGVNPTTLLQDAGSELVVKLNGNYQLLDKQNGQAVFTKPVRDFNTIYVDKDGATYLTRKDTVEKYNSSRLASLLWQKVLYDRNKYEARIVSMTLRDDGYVYYYGEIDAFSRYFIGKLSKSDGTVVWKNEPVKAEGIDAPFWALPHGMIFKGDYVYILPQQVNFGGVYTGFHAVKINKEDGTVMWNKLYDESGNPKAIYGYYRGFNSGDIDINGNLYGSGYHNAVSDLLHGEWRIMKLNAAGKFIYSNTIKAEGNITGEDVGLHTFVLDNKVYHIGFSNENGVRKVFMITTDTSGSYTPLFKKNIQITLQRSGSIKGMAPVSGGGFVMYRQQDREAVLEARNNEDKSVRWSTTFSGEDYYEADRLHVREDSVIAITGLFHLGAKASAEYEKAPRKVLLGRYNAAGTILQYRELNNKSYQFSFESAQLMNGNASNAGYIFSASTYDQTHGEFRPVGYYHVNLSLADPDFEAFAYFGLAKPYGGSTQLMTSYMKDSIVFGRDSPWWSRTVLEVTSAYYAPERLDAWSPEEGVKQGLSRNPKTQDAYFVNFAPIDAKTVTILAREKVSGAAMVVRYRIPEDSVIWVSTLNTAMTLYNASSDIGSTYGMGNIGTSLVAVKLNNTNGSTIWEKSLSAAPRQCYFPLDQQINPHTNEYIICGYIADSTYPMVKKMPFYVIFDANGNVAQQWTGQPDYIGNNQLNTICVTSDGQTLIGGSLYTRPAGKAAVLITIGGKELPVETVEKEICSSGQLALDAKLNGNSYQWQINRGTGFEDLKDSSGISGATTTGLKITGIAFSEGRYIFRCLIDGNSDDRIFNVKIASSFRPEVAIQGDTLIRVGKEATIVATFSYGGEQPSLQWEDSTAAHSWMPIPGATSGTLKYMPSKIKSKVRCVLTSSLACASSSVVVSRTMPVLIDPLTSIDPVPATQYGIKVFPNPVRDVLTISPLRVNDQWSAIQVLRMNGEMIYTMNPGRQTSISIPAGKWEAGMYILVLRKKNGESAQFRFVKM